MTADRFQFYMPGQPPSWNHMYGQRRWKELDPLTLKMVTRSSRFKERDVEKYQVDLTRIARSAKPSDFKPAHQVYVVYDMHLGRDLDADNVMKAINDALAIAIGVNDKMFLPVTASKSHGAKDPFISISVYDADVWTIPSDLQEIERR